MKRLLFVSGISLKTQELYVIVFLTRYLDLFTRFHSFYNTVMKLVFIGTSLSIVWYMKFHKVVKQTYSKDQDTLRHYFLIVPCFLLALLVNHEFTVMEVSAVDTLAQYILVYLILFSCWEGRVTCEAWIRGSKLFWYDNRGMCYWYLRCPIYLILSATFPFGRGVSWGLSLCSKPFWDNAREPHSQ